MNDRYPPPRVSGGIKAAVICRGKRGRFLCTDVHFMSGCAREEENPEAVAEIHLLGGEKVRLWLLVPPF